MSEPEGVSSHRQNSAKTHAGAEAVPGLDEPAVGVPVAPRQGVLVGMEGAGAIVGVAEKGEAEERPGLGIPREDLFQGPVPDEHGIGIRGTQRHDQASRSRLRIADPQEPVAERDHLLRAPVGFPCSGGHQRQCGGVVRLGDGGGKQRAEFAMLHELRRCEPPRERPKRAGAERLAGRSAKPDAARGRVRHPPPRAARGQRPVEDPGGVLWIDGESPSPFGPGPCRRTGRLLPPARRQVPTFTFRVRHDLRPACATASPVARAGGAGADCRTGGARGRSRGRRAYRRPAAAAR